MARACLPTPHAARRPRSTPSTSTPTRPVHATAALAQASFSASSSEASERRRACLCSFSRDLGGDRTSGAQDTLLPVLATLARRLAERGARRPEPKSADSRRRTTFSGGVPSSGVNARTGANATDDRRLLLLIMPSPLPTFSELAGARQLGKSGEPSGGGGGGDAAMAVITTGGGSGMVAVAGRAERRVATM